MAHSQPLRSAIAALTYAAMLCAVGTRQAPGQSLSDYQVKAAYVYNFAKFTEWPAHDFANANSPIRFCVLNDRLFEDELDRIVKGRSVAGHAVEVVQVRDGEQSRSCHVLFINSTQEAAKRHVLDALNGASVLTVGDSENFIKEGGMIGFVADNEHIHFEVNHKAAVSVGLYISSRLLSTAKHVIE